MSKEIAGMVLLFIGFMFCVSEMRGCAESEARYGCIRLSSKPETCK